MTECGRKDRVRGDLGARLFAPALRAVWGMGVVAACAATTLAAQEPPPLPTTSERVVSADDFGRPNQVQVGSNGDLHAAFAARGEILVVSGDGSGTRVIAVPTEEGSGIPFRLGWMGDTLYVADFRGERLLLLDARGRILQTREIAVPRRHGDFHIASPLRFLSSDRYLVRPDPGGTALAAGNPRRAPPSWVPAADPVTAVPLLMMDGQGQVERALADLPVRNQVSILAHDGEDSAMARRFIWYGEPFADQPLFAIDPTGTHAVVVERAVAPHEPVRAYTLHRIALNGDTLVSLHHSVNAVENRREWKETAVEEAARGLGGDPDAAREVAWETLHFPASLPPVSEVRVDPEGWVWIGRERVPGADLQRWEIVSPENVRFGTVEIPSNFSVRAVWKTTAWATLAAGAREDPQLHLWRFRAHPP